MGSFAWRNLMTRPLRTILALIGLSVPILGVIGLFSVSGGLRNMVGDTLSQVEGMMVLRKNAPSPVFSDLSTAIGAKLQQIPGVRIVAPKSGRSRLRSRGNRCSAGSRPREWARSSTSR